MNGIDFIRLMRGGIKFKILVIDDERSNLIAFSVTLKKLIPDCRVITAESGSSGIEIAKKEIPDTILLDIKMSGMDGFEVCKVLKTFSKTKYIPLLLITAYKTRIDCSVKGLELGADALIFKPVDETELAAQVKAMLRIKKAQDKLRSEKELLKDRILEKTEALFTSKKRYRTLFESVFDGIFIHNMYGKVLEVNRIICERLGYSKKELLGMTVADIAAPEYSKQVPELLEKLTKKKKLFFESALLTSNEAVFPVEINCRFIDFFGKKAVLSTVRDITEQKKAKKQHFRLERELQQVQKMEALVTLAREVAHDLNNILVSLFGCLELAIDDAPEGSIAVYYLEQAFKGARQARALVKQILTFSSQTIRQEKPIKLSNIIKEVIELLEASIPTNIELRLKIEGDSFRVLADETKIHQVLMNLCTNSIYAMREKSGVLEISLKEIIIPHDRTGHRNIASGPCVCLTVKDTGCGIEPDIRGRIFDPYFSTKETDEKVGIGLSVVQGIVQRYGGEISVESLVGKETTFEILLPGFEGETTQN